MYYQRHLPERRSRHYLMPFFTLLIIAGIVVAGWQGLKAIFLEDSRNTQSEQARLAIDSGSVKAMAVDSADWKNVPDRIALYEGEKIKTVGDGRASLSFSDQSVLRFDGDSEVHFETLKRKKEAPLISLRLERGRFWAKVERINNPEAQFHLTTEWLKIESRDALLAVEVPGSVYVLKGDARITVSQKEKTLKTYTVGVGQQFMMTEEGIKRLTNDEETEVIFALSDSFKESPWATWNSRKDSGLPPDEAATSPEEISSPAETTSDATTASVTVSVSGELGMEIKKPLSGDFTNKSTINVEGIYDASKIRAIIVQGKKASLNPNNQWVVYNLTLSREGENILTVEAEDSQGKKTALKPLIVNYDSKPPEAPQLKKPGKEGESVTLDSADVVISGSVGKDTHTVTVNDYRLQKYVSGNTAFEYYAKASIGNLKVGQNEYKVYAEDKAGNRSKPATITLVLPQEVFDRAAVTVPSSASSGGVTITAPNNGQNFTTTETEFLLQGMVPAETAKVVVNDYTLSKYQAGQTNWSYKASKSLGSLTLGQKNTFTVKAYDAGNVLLGSAAITIDVESGGAPSITIPTEKTSYLTTLDELVIGGTVGKWVDSVYVNDKKLLNYIPGSEKWNHTVILKPGSTIFRVVGERDGQKTSADQIEIIYQP